MEEREKSFIKKKTNAASDNINLTCDVASNLRLAQMTCE